jgi:hypothetical protein
MSPHPPLATLIVLVFCSTSSTLLNPKSSICWRVMTVMVCGVSRRVSGSFIVVLVAPVVSGERWRAAVHASGKSRHPSSCLSATGVASFTATTAHFA